MRRFALLAPLWVACSGGSPKLPPPPTDVHTNATAECVRMGHIKRDFTADFEARGLSGSAVLSYRGPGPLVLDVRGLEIREVADEKNQLLKYTVAPEQPVVGGALIITPPSDG